MVALTLEKLLEKVDLQPGQTYRCRVRGLDVELRVMPRSEIIVQSGQILPDPLHESDIMLDPWIDFPDLPGSVVVKTQPGPLWPPDIPDMPDDDLT